MRRVASQVWLSPGNWERIKRQAVEREDSAHEILDVTGFTVREFKWMPDDVVAYADRHGNLVRMVRIEGAEHGDQRGLWSKAVEALKTAAARVEYALRGWAGLLARRH